MRARRYDLAILGAVACAYSPPSQTFLEQIKSLFAGTAPRPPQSIAPTVGLNVGKLPYGPDRLSIWDLGGQLELHGIWEKYYQECHGVIFIVDAGDPERAELSVAAFTKALADAQLETVPTVILANKQDLPGAMPIDQILTMFRPYSSQLGDRDCRIQPVVALTGCARFDSDILWNSCNFREGAEQALAWLVNAMRLNAPNRRPRLN